MGWTAAAGIRCARMRVVGTCKGRPPTMGIVIVGIDLAKHVF
jgi:hypothetical protein